MVERLRAALLIIVPTAVLHAQPAPLDRTLIAFGVVEDASRLRATLGLAELREYVSERLAGAERHGAADHFLTAELLKQLGDHRAVDFYERAIAADDSEPAYELFYASYLRQFRGPRRPLFAEAERHYLAALRKLRTREASLRDQVKPKDLAKSVETIRDRIDRGLVALYQEDGIPIYWRGEGAPALFLSSTDRWARSPSDLDEVHDTRDLTAEALFSASAVRRNIALTDDDLRALVRLKEPREATARLRFRHETWPVVDVFYRGRNIKAAQVTNFFNPRAFNDVDVRAFGAAVEKTFGLARSDWYVRAALSRLDRAGLVEMRPETREEVSQVELQASTARFIGPDKLNVDARLTVQGIQPQVVNPPERNRRIGGATIEYQILRPLPFLRDPYGNLFETRGISLFGGYADDRERFGSAGVTRRDYFIGTSIRGLGRFDVTLQPGYMDSQVSGDRSQDNAQFRTEATVLVRLLDEEREPGIPKRRVLGLSPAFIHLVFPFKRDVSLTGLEALENGRFGAALHAKLFRRSLSPELPSGNDPRVRPATVLFSVRYERQRFPRLDEDLSLIAVSVSVGY